MYKRVAFMPGRGCGEGNNELSAQYHRTDQGTSDFHGFDGCWLVNGTSQSHRTDQGTSDPSRAERVWCITCRIRGRNPTIQIRALPTHIMCSVPFAPICRRNPTIQIRALPTMATRVTFTRNPTPVSQSHRTDQGTSDIAILGQLIFGNFEFVAIPPYRSGHFRLRPSQPLHSKPLLGPFWITSPGRLDFRLLHGLQGAWEFGLPP